jgi:SAM-dependent methyltransferase
VTQLVLHPPPASAPPSEEAFQAYEEGVDVNWSEELATLHEESSRTHFIDVWTRAVLLDAVSPGLSAGDVVLDAGCSDGYLLEDIRARHPGVELVGVDLVAAGLRRAHASLPDAHLLLADVCTLPIGDACISAVVSANLLEHVPDDRGALAEMHRVLRRGGTAAVMVPAAPGTYDYYDAFLGHERRYARGELAGKARDAGFEVLRDSHIGTFLFPAFWAVKKLHRRRHPDPSADERRALVESDIARTTDSRLGAATVGLERTLTRRGVSLPFGIRSYVVLRRPA